MQGPFDIDPAAFAPFNERIRWDQDRHPGLAAVMFGVVNQGSPDSTGAGHPFGTVAADQWIVNIEPCNALAEIREGDTLTLCDRRPEVELTVQRKVKTEIGWFFTCTANERSPAT